MPEKGEEYIIPQDLEDFLASGPAPVYMTFGSMISPLMGDEYVNETTRLMVDAAKLVGCRVIIQSYWDNINGIEEDPDIYRITQVPHQKIFPHCSAVVHHCGAGTTQSVTRAGCPSVVVAHMTDQVFWGNKLKQLSLALKPFHRKSITAQKLAKEIRCVLDSHNMKKKAEELGKLLRKEEGVLHAVKTIEETLGRQYYQ
jgi:UDP:flavonoid glycosyltransferase YjiC (YdhE family)